jgi:hypothetical protein
MNFAQRVLGWGVSIYAIMYLLWSGLVIYGLASGYVSLVVRIAALAVITTIAARTLHVASWKELLPYSIGWAAVTLALDAVFLVPFSGWELYTSLSVWVGYALVALFPMIFMILRTRKAPQTV